MKNGTFSYYESFAIRYHESGEDLRRRSREHWQRIHAENVKSGREDLIVFSARHLAEMAMIDAGRFADCFGV